MAKTRFSQNELQIIYRALLMTNGTFDVKDLPGQLRSDKKAYSTWERALGKVIERLRH